MNSFECSLGYRMQCQDFSLTEHSPNKPLTIQMFSSHSCLWKDCNFVVGLCLIVCIVNWVWEMSEHIVIRRWMDSSMLRPAVDLDREVRSSWTMWRMWPGGDQVSCVHWHPVSLCLLLTRQSFLYHHIPMLQQCQHHLSWGNISLTGRKLIKLLPSLNFLQTSKSKFLDQIEIFYQFYGWSK